jgi:hypothetical protein
MYKADFFALSVWLIYVGNWCQWPRFNMMSTVTLQDESNVEMKPHIFTLTYILASF